MDISLNKTKGVLQIDMLRDDCKVIERRRGDPVALKKGFAKLRRILSKMPTPKANTLADIKKTRESRGRV